MSEKSVILSSFNHFSEQKGDGSHSMRVKWNGKEQRLLLIPKSDTYTFPIWSPTFPSLPFPVKYFWRNTISFLSRGALCVHSETSNERDLQLTRDHFFSTEVKKTHCYRLSLGHGTHSRFSPEKCPHGMSDLVQGWAFPWVFFSFLFPSMPSTIICSCDLWCLFGLFSQPFIPRPFHGRPFIVLYQIYYFSRFVQGRTLDRRSRSLGVLAFLEKKYGKSTRIWTENWEALFSLFWSRG